jgi:hypothetical protein
MNRRGLLTAGAAALAVVPATATAACWFPGPDAELLELGKRFAEVTGEVDAANAAFNVIYNPISARSDRLCAGIPEGAQQHAIWKRLADEAGPAFGEAERDLFEAWDRHRDVIEAIAAIPATTMAGLAVKAAVVRQQNAELWEEHGCEFHQAPIVGLVDEIAAMALR